MTTTTTKIWSDRHWYLLVATAGFTSTTVEMTAFRFLAPLFGTSLPVWGTVIATVLGGLAFGYTLGGRHAQRHLAIAEHQIARLAAFGAAIFAWMPPAIRVAHAMRDQAITSSSPAFFIFTILLVLFIIIIPSVIFGAVSPLAVQAESRRQQQPAGQVAGRISTLTTIGSLFGILLPAFIAIPLLGLKITVWSSVLFMLALALPALLPIKAGSKVLPLLISLALISTLLPSSNNPNIIHAKETKHQYVYVEQQGQKRFLIFDLGLGVQSVYSPTKFTDSYWDYIASIPLLFPDQDELSMLVLGAATSAAERQLAQLWEDEKQFSFTSVELDGHLFDVAEQYFDPPPRQKITADARQFIVQDKNQYDIILLDLYAKELTVPAHLATTEFYAEVTRRLTPNGIVVINLNAASADTTWIRSVARTLEPHVNQLRLANIPGSCNLLLIGINQPWPTDIDVSTAVSTAPSNIQKIAAPLLEAAPPQATGLLLTDNKAPTEYLGLLAFLTEQPTTACQ